MVINGRYYLDYANAADTKLGDRVRHPRHGFGTIVAIFRDEICVAFGRGKTPNRITVSWRAVGIVRCA